MKLTKKIIAVSIIITVMLVAIGCKSYSDIPVSYTSPQMWESFAAGEEVVEKTTFGKNVLDFTSKTLDASADIVYPAAEKALKTLGKKPRVIRAKAGPGKSVVTGGNPFVKFDVTKNGELISVYKTLNFGGVQSLSEVVRVIIVPMDNQTKIGVWLGPKIVDFTVEEVFSAIESEL